MELELEPQVAHLGQGHKDRNVSLLHNVKLSRLNCVLSVVHANDQLLLALRRLGVGKCELRCGLSNGVPNATVRIVIAELHQVLRSHPGSHRSRASQIQHHRGRR